MWFFVFNLLFLFGKHYYSEGFGYKDEMSFKICYSLLISLKQIMIKLRRNND